MGNPQRRQTPLPDSFATLTAHALTGVPTGGLSQTAGFSLAGRFLGNNNLSSRQAIDLLVAAAEFNRRHPLRSGNKLHLPTSGELIITGDLHNHQRNFSRLKSFANLANFPERHVILQEMIHGGPLGADGEDTSLQMILEACDWALQFPGQIHFLLANHDLAQITGVAIMKDGYDLTERFQRAYGIWYGARGIAVAAAFRDFVVSMPLAAISATGLFLSHSLPSDSDMQGFDPSILQRDLTEPDYQRNGSVYKLLWGRNQTQALLDQLSKIWWADIYICGHQAQDGGHGSIGRNMLIIDSSHNHGVLVPMLLERQYTLPDLIQRLVPLASIE